MLKNNMMTINLIENNINMKNLHREFVYNFFQNNDTHSCIRDLLSLSSVNNPFLSKEWTVFLVLIAENVLVIVLLLGIVAFYILIERTTLGIVHRRKGPNFVGVYGLLQSVADGLKLILKETTIPSSGNTGIFLFSPVVTLFVGLAYWAIIPIAPGASIADLDLGILYLLAVSSTGVYAIIMSGWSSNSKYAFLGAIRAAAQMLSYEVAFGFSLIPMAVAAQTLRLGDIIFYQQHTCNAVYFLLPSFLIFFIAILAETNRHPFDLPEAESELVSGYNVEYASMFFALFFLGEYISILGMSALCVILFFGGWLPIFPLSNLIDPLNILPYSFWFALKIWAVGITFVYVRAVLPRYRYDQLIELSWKQLIPISMGFAGFRICYTIYLNNGTLHMYGHQLFPFFS